MTKNEFNWFLKRKPSYLKWGAKRLSSKSGLSENTVKIIVKQVKNENNN